MKTVVFTRKHNYGGLNFEPDEKLECPDERADQLVVAGVAEIEGGEKKAGGKKAGKG